MILIDTENHFKNEGPIRPMVEKYGRDEFSPVLARMPTCPLNPSHFYNPYWTHL